MKSALIVQGDWQGHEPAQVAVDSALRDEQSEVTISDTLDAVANVGATRWLGPDSPSGRKGTYQAARLQPLLEAVREEGVGIGGVHAGMGDACAALAYGVPVHGRGATRCLIEILLRGVGEGLRRIHV